MIKYLHLRLLTLSKFFVKENRGLFPFVFGEHVKKRMHIDELEFIPAKF